MPRLVLQTGIILLLMASCAAKLRAQAAREEQSLKGIQGLAVLVEHLESELEDAGLHRAEIQADVELKLRLAGIKILTREDSFKQPGAPWLYVYAHVALSKSPPSQGLVIYDISCEFFQTVALTRDPSTEIPARTWHTESLGLVGLGHIQQIRSDIKDQVDKFQNAYLSVNPKK